MALTAESAYHYWDALYGADPVVGNDPQYIRDTAGWFIDSRGLLRKSITGPGGLAAPRFEPKTLDGITRPAWLLELSQENLVTWSDALSNWSKSHSQPNAVDASVSAGDLELSLLEDDDGTNAAYYHITPSFTGNDVKSVAVAVKEGTAVPSVRLRDTTDSADRLLVYFEWSGGVPSATVVTGSQIGSAEAKAGGIYVFRFLTTSVTAGNTNQLRAYPAWGATSGGDSSETGTAYMGGFMAVDAEFCGSLIKTTGSTVTRAVDIASHVMPSAIESPSTAWTGYFRWVAGMDGNGGLSNPRVWQVGDGNTEISEAFLRLEWTSATALRLRHANGGGSGGVGGTISGLSIERGQLCEAIVAWNGDGTTTIYLWVNGTFIDSATLSGITPASAWNPDGNGDVQVYYNSRDGGSNAGAMHLVNSKFVDPADLDATTTAELYDELTAYTLGPSGDLLAA